ncbi:MAG TPA: class I SAM-dependent methyltransferase [Anaerolineales bacterium]|nr:class I SAM-dependent methyltransferase [Anaerolineales bacterium]
MTSYDDTPYPLVAHSQTHPARLATLALLHGVKPAPVERCRVLEIGCARGGNIIPMACELSDSEFVGIDASSRQIAEGRDFIQALGLKNIRLESLDLLDFDEWFGAFDYIIAHGLYSWAPQAVRDKLFDVCQRNLTAAGVAFINFNAYPGWKNLSMVRDLMLYRTRQAGDPLAKARQARELLDAVVQSMSAATLAWDDTGDAHVFFYKSVADRVKKYDLSYVVHEFFEGINSPVYFYEFVDQARRYGLQYLADINFRNALDVNLPPDVVRLVDSLTRDRVEREQYVDFLSNRSFRQVLLCRADLPINFAMNSELLRTLWFASPASPETESPAGAPTAQTFAGVDGARHSTDHPVTQAAWLHLIDIWPQSATFDELLAQAYVRLNAAPPEAEAAQADAQILADNLVKAFLTSPRLVEATVYPLGVRRQISERPVASAWARLQAQQSTTITTLRHERYSLNTLEQFVLQQLDGSYTPDMIVDRLMAGPFARSQIEVPDGEPLTDPTQIRSMHSQAVDETLHTFACLPLLVA